MHLNVHTTTADCTKAASSFHALLQQTPAMLITKLLKHIIERTMQPDYTIEIMFWQRSTLHLSGWRMTWQWYLKCWKLNKTAFLNSSINSSCSHCSFLSSIGRKFRVLIRATANIIHKLFFCNMSATDPLVMAHVIQDVLDPFTPTIPLRITYNNRLLLASAELKPSAVVSKPRVDVGGNDMRAFYTLVSQQAIYR